MADDDYAIESVDAGASATIPMEAGQIKKGGYVSTERVPWEFVLVKSADMKKFVIFAITIVM